MAGRGWVTTKLNIRLATTEVDVTRHFAVDGPWNDTLSSIYYRPEITATVEQLAAEANGRAG